MSLITYHPAAGFRLCEGVADALGIAARRDCLVVAIMSAGAMREPASDLMAVAREVRAAGGEVVVHADPDPDNRPMNPKDLARLLAAKLGGRAMLPAVGDPADTAAASPFGKIDLEAARSYADTLRVQYPDAPNWEVVRQTAVALDDPPDGGAPAVDTDSTPPRQTLFGSMPQAEH